MKRQEALDFWAQEQLQAMIFAFNRFKKLQALSAQTALSLEQCQSLLGTHLTTLSQFYDFAEPKQRLLLLSPMVIERLCLFLGASHFAKELTALSFSKANQELLGSIDEQALSFSKSQGRFFIANKRAPSNTQALAMSKELLCYVGARYLELIDMSNSLGDGQELNEAWHNRLRVNELPPDLISANELSLKIVPIENNVILTMVLRIIERYEEDVWTAFFK